MIVFVNVLVMLKEAFELLIDDVFESLHLVDVHICNDLELYALHFQQLLQLLFDFFLFEIVIQFQVDSVV